MNKRTPVAIGCPIVSDITDILLTDIYRKEHAKMSQGLLLKNKNGAVLLSDSALTGIDDSGAPFVISKDYEKIWKGKDYVAVHAGLLTYADDVKRTLDDVTKPFSTRLNIIVDNFSMIMRNVKKPHFNYQLIAVRENNSILECYMFSINSINETSHCLTSFGKSPLAQPIGLYSPFIVDSLSPEMIKDWTLEEMLENGTKILQYILELDAKQNQGLFVNGSIRALMINNDGNIFTYKK